MSTPQKSLPISDQDIFHFMHFISGHLHYRGQGIRRLVMLLVPLFTSIRASVDALCRDGTSEISRDPRTKRLQTRRESLARPSKHTNNNF